MLQYPDYLPPYVLLMRIMFAVLCGTLIGYEREHSLKAAGLRTHIIVAAASCLMMTI
ncbi:hypothetical protein HMPREF9554_01770 [Treponema phagedenis F0421]|nr:hypothetical protein HMPREF9554_01770 [Treponema phagedenis F0421]